VRKNIQQAEQEQITIYLSLSLFQELEETLKYPKPPPARGGD